MNPITFSYHSGFIKLYTRNQNARIDFTLPTFKNYYTLIARNLGSTYLRNGVIKTANKIHEHWLHGDSLIYIESENILVGKGIVLDAETLDILIVTVVPKKYINVGYTNKGYLNRCLEIYVSQDFVGSKAFNKLQPFIKNIKLIALPNKELKKLYG
jgi:hypothetical protein